MVASAAPLLLPPATSAPVPQAKVAASMRATSGPEVAAKRPMRLNHSGTVGGFAVSTEKAQLLPRASTSPPKVASTSMVSSLPAPTFGSTRASTVGVVRANASGRPAPSRSVAATASAPASG